MKRRTAPKSPIREPLLRNPGETLEKQIDKLVNEDAMSYGVIGIFMIVLIIWEWFRYLTDYPPSPITFSIVGAISLPFIIFRFLKIRKQLRNIRQGLQGEKYVGQTLELLRETGAKVFHDIPAKDFNIDHLIISENGIFAIETKTYSKTSDQENKILFDGTYLTLGNGYRTDEPLIQARAASQWLHQLIQQMTGKKFYIQPVIVFPGWFIQNKAKSNDIWVLNPKALPTYISNNKTRISEEDVNLIAYNIETYIKNLPA